MKKEKSIIVFILMLMITFSSCTNFQNNVESSDLSSVTETAFDDMVFDVVDTNIISDDEFLLGAFAAEDSLFCVKTVVSPSVIISEYDKKSGKKRELTFLKNEFENGLETNYKIYSDSEYWYVSNNMMNSALNGVYIIDKKDEKIISYIKTENNEIIDIGVSENERVYILCEKNDVVRKQNILYIYEGLECLKKIDIDKVLNKYENYDSCCICNDNEGNIFLVYDTINEKRIVRFNSNEEVFFDVELKSMWGRNFDSFSSSDGSIIVCCEDVSSTIINRIDADTGETFDYYQCNLEGCDTVGFMDDDSLLLCDEKNVYTFCLSENDIASEAFASGRDEVFGQYGDKLISVNIMNLYVNSLTSYSLNSLKEESTTKIDVDEIVMFDSNFRGKICFVERSNGAYCLVLADYKGNILKRKQLETRNRAPIDIAYDQSGSIYILFDDDMECLSVVDELSEEFICISENQIKDSKCSFGLDIYQGQLYVEYYMLNDGCCEYKNIYQKETEEFSIGNIKIEKIYLQSSGEALVKSEKQTIIRCSAGSDETTPLFDIDSLPVSFGIIENIIYVDDNNLFVCADSKLYKVTSDNIEGKKVLRVATDISGKSIEKYTESFRVKHPDTLIKLIDYYKADSQDLIIDIAAGNIPDIIISNGNLDLSIFECKNLLLDLSDYIPEGEYYDNIFDALDNTEKITQITNSFSIFTAVGKQSDFGEQTGWTYNEYLQKKENIYFGHFERSVWDPEFLAQIQFSEFINTESEKIYVSEYFSDYLELLRNMYNHNTDEDNYSLDKAEQEDKYLRRFLDGECNIDVFKISHVSDVYRLRYAYINEPIVFKGLPSDRSNGSYISPDMRMSILNSCNDPDTAWDFISEFLSYDEQLEIAEYGSGFPVLKSALNKMMENYTEDSVYVGDELIKINTHDMELNNQMYELFESLMVSVHDDKNLNSILGEEFSVYFSSNIFSEEIIDSLKSKIRLYLSEIS